MPKISVIMAAFNEEANIQNAILSIQDQTFKEWELVIVDDGSDDGTLNLINDAVSLDSRITCLSNDKNIGLAMSLNKAISFSNSEYIARMDADDYSLPDRLETQLNFMQGNPDISVLGTGGIYCDQSSNISLDNVTIIENEAINGSGGGIEIRDSDANIINSKISNNSAGNKGGGIRIANSSSIMGENILIYYPLSAS